MAMWIGLDGHEKLLDPPVEVLKKGGSSHDEYRPIDGRDGGFGDEKGSLDETFFNPFLLVMFVIYYDYADYGKGT